MTALSKLPTARQTISRHHFAEMAVRGGDADATPTGLNDWLNKMKY